MLANTRLGSSSLPMWESLYSSARFSPGPISQPSPSHKTPLLGPLELKRVVGISSSTLHLLSEHSLPFFLPSPLHFWLVLSDLPHSSGPRGETDLHPRLLIFPHFSLRTSRLGCGLDRPSPTPPRCCHLLCQDTHAGSDDFSSGLTVTLSTAASAMVLGDISLHGDDLFKSSCLSSLTTSPQCTCPASHFSCHSLLISWSLWLPAAQPQDAFISNSVRDSPSQVFSSYLLTPRVR